MRAESINALYSSICRCNYQSSLLRLRTTVFGMTFSRFTKLLLFRPSSFEVYLFCRHRTYWFSNASKGEGWHPCSKIAPDSGLLGTSVFVTPDLQLALADPCPVHRPLRKSFTAL